MSMRNPSGFVRPGYNPLKVADAPTAVVPTAGVEGASVDFTPPVDIGGAPVTDYYAVVQPGNITATSVTPPVAVTGLTIGTTYTTKVWANNSYGPSPYSPQSGGFVPVAASYVEDVFSTYLYAGNSSTQTITNGIDLDGEGGLVWLKDRLSASLGFHIIYDTEGGTGPEGGRIFGGTAGTNPRGTQADGLQSFDSTGFTLGANTYENGSGKSFASWTFRKQPKFFDVVAWTGNGASSRQIAHSLGSAPGCIIVKKTSSAIDSEWNVYHRSLASNTVPTPTQSKSMFLNGTGAAGTWNIFGDHNTQTSTYFTLGTANIAYHNELDATYVAYIFAHDAGGFGDDGEQNVISCGVASYPVSGDVEVNLGWEPQWVLMKDANHNGNSWWIMDTMRGWDAQKTGGAFSSSTGGNLQALFAENANAEVAYNYGGLTSTGFKLPSNFNYGDGNTNLIYIAIRRPMKTPESGTEVFKAVPRTANGAVTYIDGLGFPPDMVWSQRKDSAGNSPSAIDKLRGPKQVLFQNMTNNEATSGASFDVDNFNQDGVVVQSAGSQSVINYQTAQVANWFFKRAPGFMDVVCYTGTGVAHAEAHNLGVVPELMIVKCRSAAGPNWSIYTTTLGNQYVLYLEKTQGSNGPYTIWNNTTPTSSVFSVGTSQNVNGSGDTYVAYLFATLAGVSKVGSYTGTGADLNVDCGFSAGARFVLIKRTDTEITVAPTTGWYVWDSARGIVAGNDPYLLLNDTAAEVTNTDYIDLLASGFTVTATAPAALNASGGTYIFLAIA